MVTDTRSITPIAGQKIRVVAKLTPVRARAGGRRSRRGARVAVETDPRDRRRRVGRHDKPDTTEPIERPRPRGPTRATVGSPWQYDRRVVTVGVGALALGVGITGQVLWSQKNNEFNGVEDPVDTADQVQPRSRPTTAAVPARACKAADQRLTLAIVGYAIAGAASITALIFYSIAPSQSDAHVGRRRDVAGLPADASAGLSCALTRDSEPARSRPCYDATGPRVELRRAMTPRTRPIPSKRFQGSGAICRATLGAAVRRLPFLMPAVIRGQLHVRRFANGWSLEQGADRSRSLASTAG